MEDRRAWDAWPDTDITVRTAVGRVIIAVEDIWQVVTTAEAARYLGQLLIAAAAQADDAPTRRTLTPEWLDPPPETAPVTQRNLLTPDKSQSTCTCHCTNSARCAEMEQAPLSGN